MQISLNLDTTANTLSVTVDGTHHTIPLPVTTPASVTTSTTPTSVTTSITPSSVPSSPTPSVSCDQIAGPPSTPSTPSTSPTPLTIMTWNVDNWSSKKNHSKSISPDDSASYAAKVRNMLSSVSGDIPSLLALQEYGVVFDLAGNMTTDTALADYPASGHYEWLKNGKKADYWAPGGFSNNSSMVNGIPAKVIYDALWLWGSKATRSECKKAGVELKYYYDNEDGSLNIPNGLKESDVKTPIGEFAHVLELTISGKKVAWANAHLYPSSNRKDYPYNKDVVNWMCLKNLMHVLRNYDYVIICGDMNWISSKFMLDYDEAESLNKTNYPTVKDEGGEANRYKYAGAGKQGYITADYALCGYGQTKNRGNNGETDFDVLNTVDCILAKGFRITKVRKLATADWFDKDHFPIFAQLEML